MNFANSFWMNITFDSFNLQPHIDDDHIENLEVGQYFVIRLTKIDRNCQGKPSLNFKLVRIDKNERMS